MSGSQQRNNTHLCARRGPTAAFLAVTNVPLHEFCVPTRAPHFAVTAVSRDTQLGPWKGLFFMSPCLCGPHRQLGNLRPQNRCASRSAHAIPEPNEPTVVPMAPHELPWVTTCCSCCTAFLTPLLGGQHEDARPAAGCRGGWRARPQTRSRSERC